MARVHRQNSEEGRYDGNTRLGHGAAGCIYTMVQEWSTTASVTPRARLLQEQRKRSSGFSQAPLSQEWPRRRSGVLLCVLLGAGLLVVDLLLILFFWRSLASTTNPDPQWPHSGEEGDVKVMAARPQFVLFGDSITQQSFRPGGWGAALADRYARKVFISFSTATDFEELPKIFPYFWRLDLLFCFACCRRLMLSCGDIAATTRAGLCTCWTRSSPL